MIELEACLWCIEKANGRPESFVDPACTMCGGRGKVTPKANERLLHEFEECQGFWGTVEPWLSWNPPDPPAFDWDRRKGERRES